MNPLFYTNGWFGTAWYSIEPSVVRQAAASLRTWFSRRIASLAAYGDEADADFGWKYPAF